LIVEASLAAAEHAAAVKTEPGEEQVGSTRIEPIRIVKMPIGIVPGAAELGADIEAAPVGGGVLRRREPGG
jgi:hypothetical protein